MRWLVDAQLPPSLALFLRKEGEEANHVEEIGLGKSDDTAIWEYALENECIILTKDEDFIQKALIKKNAPKIVWIRIGNCVNRVLLSWFSSLFLRIIKSIQEGENIIEVQ